MTRERKPADDQHQSGFISYLAGSEFTLRPPASLPKFPWPPRGRVQMPRSQENQEHFDLLAIDLEIRDSTSTQSVAALGEIQIDVLEGQIDVVVEGATEPDADEAQYEIRVRIFDASNGTFQWNTIDDPAYSDPPIQVTEGSRIVIAGYTHRIMNSNSGPSRIAVTRYGFGLTPDNGEGCNPCLRYPP